MNELASPPPPEAPCAVLEVPHVRGLPEASGASVEECRRWAIGHFGRECVDLYEWVSQPLRHPSFWNTRGVEGVHRFLDTARRVLQLPLCPDFPDPVGRHKLHVHLAACLAVADLPAAEVEDRRVLLEPLMKLIRTLAEWKCLPAEAMLAVAQLLHPHAPETAAAAYACLVEAEPEWCRAGLHARPVVDPDALISPEIRLNVLVNGQRYDAVLVNPRADLETIVLAATTFAVQSIMGTRVLQQVVVLPGRLVNFITENARNA